MQLPDVDAIQLFPVNVQREQYRERYEPVIISCAAMTVQLPAGLASEHIDRWVGAMAGLYV
jgi:hypothetical protein